MNIITLTLHHEILFLSLCAGILFMALFFCLAMFLRWRTQAYQAIFFTTLLHFCFVAAEIGVSFISGENAMAVVAQLTRAQHILSLVLPLAILIVFHVLLDTPPRFVVITKWFVRIAGGIALVIIFVSFLYPKAFYTVNTQIGVLFSYPITTIDASMVAIVAKDILVCLSVVYMFVLLGVASYGGSSSKKRIARFFLVGTILTTLFAVLGSLYAFYGGTFIPYRRFTILLYSGSSTFFVAFLLFGFFGHFLEEAKHVEETYSLLAESEEKFRSIIEQADTGVIIMDGNGRITEWNTAMVDMTGYGKDVAVNNDIYTVFSSLIRNDHATQLSSQSIIPHGYFARGAWEKLLAEEYNLFTRDGYPRTIEVVTFPVRMERSVMVVSLCRDVTDTKLYEIQLEEYSRRIRHELLRKRESIEKAQALQKSLNPITLPVMREGNIHALYMPSEELGGDFFDIRKIGDRLIVILADCTGHGIESSMHATLLKTISDKYVAFLAAGRPDMFLQKTNTNLLLYFHDTNYPTMFACVFDLTERTLTYANANGELPYVIRDKGLRQLEKVEGFHLGYVEDTVYEKKITTMNEGETFFFFSDALIEIQKENHEILRESFLESILCKFTDALDVNFDHLIEELSHVAFLPLEDDTTAIAVSFTPKKTTTLTMNSIAGYDDLERFVQKEMRYLSYSTEATLFVLLACEELIKNAITHGNNNDPSKCVTVSCDIDGERILISIADEGCGFNPKTIPDPTDIERILALIENNKEEVYTHGRGIWLVKQYMDRLTYNEQGNTVTIEKRKTPVKTRFRFFTHISERN